MRIELDDLSRPEIHALLQEHLLNMHALSPPESVQRLYANAGFTPCGPFGEYVEDPHSTFMTLRL